MTVTLPPELERALIEQARRQGTSPELLAVDYLRERFGMPFQPDEPPAGTPYDFLAGFIGTLHSGEQLPGGAQMSRESGRKFTAGLVAKRQAGKL